MNFPSIGTSEKTARSNYQVTLFDKTQGKMRPMQYPKSHKFFETIEERNEFVRQIEISVQNIGGKLKHDKRLDHPLFTTFQVIDSNGNVGYSLTVYH